MTHATMSTAAELHAQAEKLRRQHAEEVGVLNQRHAAELDSLRAHHIGEAETLWQQHSAESEELRLRIVEQEAHERRRREADEENRRRHWEAQAMDDRRQKAAEERKCRRAWDIVRGYLDDFAPIVAFRFEERGDRPRRVGSATAKPAWAFVVHDDVPDAPDSQMTLAFHRDGTWSLVGQCPAGRPALVDPHAPLHMGLRQGFVYDTADTRRMAEVVYSIHPLDLRELILDYLR